MACRNLASLHDSSPAGHTSQVTLCLLQGWQRAWGPSWSPWLRSRSSRKSCSNAVRCAAHPGLLSVSFQPRLGPPPHLALLGLGAGLLSGPCCSLGAGACPSPAHGPVLTQRLCLYVLGPECEARDHFLRVNMCEAGWLPFEVCSQGRPCACVQENRGGMPVLQGTPL